MMSVLPPQHRLLLTCPDQPGIVAAVSGLLASAGANITDSAQHSDGGAFAMRVQFSLPQTSIAALREQLTDLADTWRMKCKLVDADAPAPRVAVLCSRENHCLLDLLWRADNNELSGVITEVVATVDTHARQVEAFRVPFQFEPVTDGGMPAHEAALLQRLRGSVDVVVLARYMRILSGEFLAELGCPAINIHHSFLPAFPGAGPYERAYERGVKLIGATAHYVTAELDAGPIIEQDVVRVNHTHSPDDLRRLGADVERVVLARAVRAHLEDRVAVLGDRTVVFGAQ